jgi:benzoyl-CoA reductase/2-hydroxyglutaryl-CoA dehydratase subunit BcrC/BadD/HgdB
MKVLKKMLEELSKSGRSAIGCFPLYPPLELFHSMNLAPVVLWGLKNQITTISESEKHVQNYACSVAQHLLEFLLSPDGDVFESFFMYNACDTLRNLPEILHAGLFEKQKDRPIFKIHIPQVSPPTTYGRNYLEAQIQKLISDLQRALKTRFTKQAFLQSTTLYNQMRALVLKAEERVREGFLSFSAYSQAIMTNYYLPIEAQISQLEALLNKGSSAGSKAQKRVIISGILPPSPKITRIIEKSGMRIVCNDTASITRSHSYSPPISDDPLKYYVDYYFNHYPCTTLLYTADKRVPALLHMIKENAVEGFILLGEKFCEYEYFEFPYLEKTLKKQGIKTLFLEFAIDDYTNVESYKTRIEAFREILD